MVKRRNTFTLTHNESGQSIKALVIARSTGGKFMKVWQGKGWERRLDGLQGNSLRVLWHLVTAAGWNNQIPQPSKASREIGKKQQIVSRAYVELLKADFLCKTNGVYSLHPLFCWKGNEEQYEEAVRALVESQRQSTVPPAVVVGYREISQAAELD